MKEKKKFYQKKWFLWLCLIVLPPVGIILLWTVHKTMKKKTKVILSVVFTLWFIILIGASNSSSDTPTNTGNDTPQTEQEEMSTTEETNAEEAETVPHREGMYGVSDRDIESLDIDNQFTVSDVINDVTGNWKISVINKSMNFEEYALSYYKKYFTDDSEIHAIVNFAYNTTTKIQVLGDTLGITVYEYVKDEEHDAKKLFGGMLYSEYRIYLDNGDIAKVERTDNSDVEATPENFISDIKSRIGGNTVTDVTLEDSNLCIYVDTNANTTTLPIENWATIQAVSITDSILSLSTQYDVLWETITLDFGEAGKIVNAKSDMDATERCFLDFVLE
jgi:hypothetical protein